MVSTQSCGSEYFCFTDAFGKGSCNPTTQLNQQQQTTSQISQGTWCGYGRSKQDFIMCKTSNPYSGCPSEFLRLNIGNANENGVYTCIKQ